MSPHTVLPADVPEHTLRVEGLVQEASGKRLLHGVSFALSKGELVAVLGPSGAGKSLLVELLVGAARPAGGVLQVFGRAPTALPGRVGYVPQGDVVHGTLTVREALTTTARLRAPHLCASPLLLEARVAEVVTLLGLEHRQGVRVARLSGGERRRVALAAELMSEPDVLVCDEVTSGLDVEAERWVVECLTRLAAGGTTVVCVTHTLAHVQRFDRLLVLHSGWLVFDGSPDEARAHFEVDDLERVYSRLGARDAHGWVRATPPVRGIDAALPPRPRLPGPAGLHQLPTLVLRQLRLTAREGYGLALLLAQAPLIALLVAFAYDTRGSTGRVEVGFKLVLAAIWLGCISGCQELVKERAIYRRERLAGLSPHAYLAAKAIGLTLVVLAQTGLLVGAYFAAEDLGEPLLSVLAPLTAAALAGASLGLLISAGVGSRTAAVGITPLVLVPQIVFVGTLEPLRGFASALGKCMPSHWGNEAIRRVLLDGAPASGLDLLVLAAFAGLFLVGAWGMVLLRDGAKESAR